MLFGAERSAGVRVIRMVSLEEGLKAEARGAWRRKYDPMTRMLIGFELLGSAEQAGDRDLKSLHSSASISRREMELNVERSRTAGLTEERRLERAANHQLPEDQVERVQCKVLVYPVINGKSGDILRVWPRSRKEQA